VVSITPWPHFTLGKEPPVPIGQEAGWALELVWMQRLEEKSSASVGDRTSVVQSVVSHNTDWVTPAMWLSLPSINCIYLCLPLIAFIYGRCELSKDTICRGGLIIGDVDHGLGPHSLRGPARGGHATICYATSSKHRRRTFLFCPEADKHRLRYNIGQDKVSDLSILFIELSITRNLNCDQIVKSFARDKAQKKGYAK
jgi:hypothetical protein